MAEELTIKLPKELQFKSASKLLSKALIELLKQDILNRYKKTREVTDEEWEFCEQIDWHPVDELPLKKEFVRELEQAKNEPTGKVYNSTEEFFKDLDSR